MYKIEQFIIKFFVRTILWLSVLCFSIWTIQYSGLIWEAGKFYASLAEVIKDLSENWGPIFGPTAAIIFLVSMFKTNLKYEIANDVSKQVSINVKNTFERVTFKRTREHMISLTVKGIRSMFYGVKQVGLRNDRRIDLACELAISRFKKSAADAKNL